MMKSKTGQSQKKQKQCHFCINKGKQIDYKDNEGLRRFTSSYMKIQPRKRSGLCAKHQRQIARAIKQARIAGLLAFVPK